MRLKFSILFATIALAFGYAWHASGQTQTFVTTTTNITVWVTNTVQVLQPVPPSTNPPVIAGPLSDVWNFITTEGVSNWVVATYGIYSTDTKTWGGGVGIGYKLSDFVVPTLRLDYLAGEVWMPSANLQLQVPVVLFGKLKATPFTFAGVATAVSGAGADNGSAVGMLGIGVGVALSDHWRLLGDYELWSGGRFNNDNQIRFGVGYRF